MQFLSKMMARSLTALIILILSFPSTYAAHKNRDTWMLRGVVCDSLTMQPVEAASIVTEGGGAGTLSREDGTFELKIPASASYLSVSCLGYKKKISLLQRGDENFTIIPLSPSDYALKEIVVTRKKEKYSKKNNPAVDFVNKIRNARDKTDPLKHDNYSYDKYERITLGLNNFGGKEEKEDTYKKYPFLWEHVDTSEVSGTPVLSLAVKEKASEVYYSKKGPSPLEYITGVKREGIDDFVDPEMMQTFLDDLMREIDLYKNDINLLHNRFVSPLSRIAPDFYKFYLTDTVDVGDERCIVLTFVPHNSATFGFVGQVYVPEADTTMFIKKVSMRIPQKINLNFIDRLYISQEFERAPDGTRLKTKDDFVVELSLFGNSQGVYARRNTAYSNHSFCESKRKDEFSGSQTRVTEPGAYKRDDKFWAQARQVAIPKGEGSLDDMVDKLKEVPLYFWGTRVLKIAAAGYCPTNFNDNSKWDFGPLTTFVSHNDLEGWRFHVGGMTTANLSKKLFGRGYAAWATQDHKWKYSAEFDYSFIDKTYHSREFPMQGIRVSTKYDVNRIGQDYSFTNPDNIFLSLTRMKDRLMNYHRETKVQWIMELYNNFSITLGASHNRQEISPYVRFVDGYGNSYNHYQQIEFDVQLRYAPGEKFYQTNTGRLPANRDAPIFILSHKVSPKGFLGGMFTINRTEFVAQKRIWLSAFGYMDAILKCAHVWGRTPYPSLPLPNANVSYTQQPESFAMMNPMEFVTDSHASWFLTYWANGAILNYVPFVKKLKLREVFSFNGVWGYLSKKNDPIYDPKVFRFPDIVNTYKLDRGPYMEASVGLDNVLKIFRIDYVWRLNYRDHIGISKSGFRINLHITF